MASSSSSTKETKLWKLLKNREVENVRTFGIKIAEIPAVLRKITKKSENINMEVDFAVWTTTSTNKNAYGIHGIAVKVSKENTGYEICFLHCKLSEEDGILDLKNAKQNLFEDGLLQKEGESSLAEEFSEMEELLNLDSMKGDAGSCSTMEAVLRDMEIPDNFFQSMRDLLVLDICHSGIYSLPVSIFQLNKLSVLILINCRRLSKLPPLIGQLKSLQHLDLSFTQIRNLPAEIGSLDNLQKLGLRKVELQTFPIEISNLPSLEELGMFQGFSNWSNDSIADGNGEETERSCCVGLNQERSCCVSLKQVADITNLSSLQIMVEKLECFNDGVIERINSLRQYSLIICPKFRAQHMDDFSNKNFSKVLVVQLCKCSSLDRFGILDDLECLVISICRRLSSLSLLVGVQKNIERSPN